MPEVCRLFLHTTHWFEEVSHSSLPLAVLPAQCVSLTHSTHAVLEGVAVLTAQ